MNENDEKTGAELIAAERQRQLDIEGYSTLHDRGHSEDLVDAAIAYSYAFGDATDVDVSAIWPWDAAYWKPTGDRVRDLVKAGALIAAAIDSIQSEAVSS